MGRTCKVSATAGAGPADGTAEVDRSGSGLVAVLVRGPGSGRGMPRPGRAGTGRQGRAGSPQGRADEGRGELLEVTAGSVGELAQRPLPGEHGQPVHRGPD